MINENDNKHEQIKKQVEDNLKKQFQQLNSQNDVPEELKNEVFNTLDTLNLIGDVFDLFTTKFSEAELQFMEILSDGKNTNSLPEEVDDLNPEDVL